VKDATLAISNQSASQQVFNEPATCNLKPVFIEYQRINGFTPLESPSIYAGYGGNGKYQLPIEGGVKALPFLTGFTLNS